MVRRVLFVAMVVTAVSGCGVSNGGDADPRAYARAVCSGLLTWQRGIAADSAQLSAGLKSGASDVVAVRARYAAFFGGAVTRTDQLLATVTAAGAPEVDDGLGYARDLTDALTTTRKGLADAQARFARLPTGDLRSYVAGAAKVRDSLGTVFTQVGGALDRLGSTYTDDDLTNAFRDEPDCRSLT